MRVSRLSARLRELRFPDSLFSELLGLLTVMRPGLPAREFSKSPTSPSKVSLLSSFCAVSSIKLSNCAYGCREFNKTADPNSSIVTELPYPPSARGVRTAAIFSRRSIVCCSAVEPDLKARLTNCNNPVIF